MPKGYPTRKPIPVPLKLWPKVNMAGPWHTGLGSSCWEWTGYTDSNGYGRLKLGGRISVSRATHRIAYELLVGPIAEGLELDHLCRNRRCCNPLHLEPVTHRENMRRSDGIVGRKARQTHCKRGHEFTDQNTYRRPDGCRVCRTCARWAKNPQLAER
jgi:hypothetical protein